MDKIQALKTKYGFRIIEDASHAIGASFKTKKVGSCAYSDITVFSFHPVKIITTGEGGMAMTNNSELASRMSMLRTHGITNKKIDMETRDEAEIWNYQQKTLGFNYRMSDIQAALGITQIVRLDEFVKRRHEIANIYYEAFEDLPVVTQRQISGCYSSFHLFPIRISEKECGKSQKVLYQALIDDGVAANLHYIPVHRHPYYEKIGFKSGEFPEAENFHREAISLPIFPTLKLKHQQKVIKSLKKAIIK